MAKAGACKSKSEVSVDDFLLFAERELWAAFRQGVGSECSVSPDVLSSELIPVYKCNVKKYKGQFCKKPDKWHTAILCARRAGARAAGKVVEDGRRVICTADFEEACKHWERVRTRTLKRTGEKITGGVCGG